MAIKAALGFLRESALRVATKDKARKRKKLLILINNLAVGGAERLASYLSTYRPEDFDVVFCLLDRRILYPVKARVYVIGRPGRRGFLSALLKLWRILLKEKPDAVLASLQECRRLAAFCVGVRRVITIDNYDVRLPFLGLIGRLPPPLREPLTRSLAFSNAHLIIPPSRYLGEVLINRFKLSSRRVKTIPLPIDVEAVKKLSQEPLEPELRGLFEGHKVVISVGRLVRQKGHWHLVRLFKRVKEQVPDSKLVIVGKGAFMSYLEGLIKSLGLEGECILLGFRSNQFKYMSRSALFVLPSLWEGFSYVVLEALAVGLPVMASDCLTGPREILAPGTRYRVEGLKQPEYAEYGILMPTMDGRLYGAYDPLTWQEQVWADEVASCLLNHKRVEPYRVKGPRRAEDFDVHKVVNEYFMTALGLKQG